MAWQYQHYHPQTYSSIYSQAQEQYAGQTYQQAWYNYYQQQARAVAAAQQAGTATTSTATTVPAPTGSTTVTPVATVAPIPTAPATSTTFSTYNPTFVRESTLVGSGSGSGSGSGTGGRGPRRQSQLKGLFSKELPKLMYGFGDDKQVAADTVAVMEEILIEYIVDVCQTALSPTKKNRLQIEDLRRALSRPADAKKLARMEELLFMQEDIKRARKQFEENEMGGGTGDY